MSPAWIAVPAMLPLFMTLVNRFTWAVAGTGGMAERPLAGAMGSGPLAGAMGSKISALVPARNEATNIEACVRALLAAGVDEVWVYDDGSADATPTILAALAAEDARVHVIRGEGPPAGWLGKAHACHRLALASTGDILLFVDADVRVAPGLRERLGAALDGVDVVTAVPRQVTGSFAEHLVLPLLHLTYESWLPLALVERVRTPLVTAANGQLIAMRRPVYRWSGGYEAVRSAVVDDMALCRHLKRRGFRVRMADGQSLASCRMYRGAAEVMDGFSKNLYPGIGGTPVALAVVLVLYAACFLLPWLALPFEPVAAGVGIAANLTQRVLLAVRHRHHPLAVLLHPVAILVFMGIAVRSAWWTVSGRARWRGRSVLPQAGDAGRSAAETTAAMQTWTWSLAETARRWGRSAAGWYARWRARGSLDGVWVDGLDGVQAAVARGPVIFAMNHVSWWDGLVMILVDRALDLDGRVLVLADSVRRMPFLRWIGAIPLEPGLAGAAALAEAARHLDGPRRVVWIFPQGRQRPAAVRPLGFARGVEMLARRTGAEVVPVALDYPFRSVHVPAAVVGFAPPLRAAEATVARLEAAVAVGLDHILTWADGAGARSFGALLPTRVRSIESRAGARLLTLRRASALRPALTRPALTRAALGAALLLGLALFSGAARAEEAYTPLGQWRMEMVVATRALIPVLGATRAEVRSVLDVTISDGPDGLTQTQRVCSSELIDRGKIVRTILPAAFVRSLPVASFPVVLTPGPEGWSYAADFGAQAVGWDGVGALPREAGEPGVIDWDGDGRPGATVQVQAPLVGVGEVYVVQQGRTRVTGKLGADGAITGSVSVVGFGQAVIGASSALLRHAPTVEQDPARSWFRMVRAEEAEACRK